MTKKIEQRKLEILEALQRNPSGLTTAQIVADCIKQVGAETPDNITVASGNIFQLRRSEYLQSFDTEEGKVHTITAKGLAELGALTTGTSLDTPVTDHVITNDNSIPDVDIPDVAIQIITTFANAKHPNDEQIGGDHYKSKTVQPWDAMEAWLTPEQFKGFLRGNIIKYLARYDDKGGVEDLKKARHYLDKLINT